MTPLTTAAMMTEQQLQEIERLDARIECPDCGGMGTLGEIDSDMPEDRCQECDGTGDVARWPYAAALIAEVRRLQQQVEQGEVTVALLRDFTTRERALRDAVGKGGQHVGYGPSINPTTLRELERMLTDAPSTAYWLGEQVKAAQQERDEARIAFAEAQERFREELDEARRYGGTV